RRACPTGRRSGPRSRAGRDRAWHRLRPKWCRAEWPRRTPRMARFEYRSRRNGGRSCRWMPARGVAAGCLPGRARACWRRDRMALRRAVVLLVSTGVLLAACAAGPAKDIKGTLEEWKITLTPTTGAAGEVTFTIDNIGEKDHEFVIVKTDLAPDKLPTIADGAEKGTVDEEGEGITAVDELEDIKSGTD